MQWIRSNRRWQLPANDRRKHVMNKREVGGKYESRAAEYLSEHGVEILERNYRTRRGEIDLIGRDGEYLVFFEVKERSGVGSGYAAEAVTLSKRRTICAVSERYLFEKKYGSDTAVRYDVIAIDRDSIEWIKNAFEYMGRTF